MHHGQQIPVHIQHFAHIALHVTVAAILRGQQITGPGVMAAIEKRPAHRAAGFAADQNFQLFHCGPSLFQRHGACGGYCAA